MPAQSDRPLAGIPPMTDTKKDAGLEPSTRPIMSWALSDSDYRPMVDAISDYAIFCLDPNGYVLTWNTGAERLKGYHAQEIIGRHFSVFYPQSRINESWPDHELRAARENGSFEDEGWRVRKDGSRSEEHTSELQSLMRISYAAFCLKKKKKTLTTQK